jgi:hypothetical protein
MTRVPLNSRDRVTDVDHLGMDLEAGASGRDYVI